MPRAKEAPKRKRTVDELAVEVDALRERVEDLEDLRDLRAAVRRNGEKKLIPWTKVKSELGVD
jgi:hypothetical protein